MTTLHPDLKKVLPKMREANAAVWPALTIYILHANIRNRAWPNLDTLARETGFVRQTVIEAKAWLVEHGALEKVGYQLRVERERIHPKMDVMQLTGEIHLSGEVFRYLIVPETSETAEINSLPSRPLAQICDVTNLSQQSTQQTINSLPSRPEVTTAAGSNSRPEPEPALPVTASMLFMENISPNLGPIQIEKLMDAEAGFGLDVMREAITEAVDSKPSGERKYISVNFVLTIAARIADGRPKPKAPSSKNGSYPKKAGKPSAIPGASQALLDAHPGLEEQLREIYHIGGKK